MLDDQNAAPGPLILQDVWQPRTVLMARMLIRLLRRLAILGLGIISVWLIVFVVFDFADQRLPWAVALGVTYAMAGFPYAFGADRRRSLAISWHEARRMAPVSFSDSEMEIILSSGRSARPQRAPRVSR
jgi:hypothetical protein